MTPTRLRALDLAAGQPPTATAIDRVARATSVADARWAFQQWDLRKRARAKFAKADEMLFDRDGLEMATHEQIAAYHASRFPAGVEVADLTCGIGADLIALARRGPAMGYDTDPSRAAFARHNLGVNGVDADVVENDGLSAKAQYVFCDPARRAEGRRTLNIDDFAPDPRLVVQCFQDSKLLGLKLSPMLSDRDLESFGGAVEFVSFGGECREALVWIGRSDPRAAVHIESGSRLEAAGAPVQRDAPLRYVAEADPAAIRAHCLGSFALHALGDSNGYLTSDSVAASAWLTWYEVLASHAADVKRTRAGLRQLGGGTPIVKLRGAKLDIARIRQELRGKGEELVLVIYPVGKSLRHIICRRLS